MKTKTPREYAFDRFSEAYHDPKADPADVSAKLENYLALCLAERVRPTNSWLNTAREICYPMVSA